MLFQTRKEFPKQFWIKFQQNYLKFCKEKGNSKEHGAPAKVRQPGMSRPHNRFSPPHAAARPYRRQFENSSKLPDFLVNHNLQPLETKNEA